MLCGQSGVGKTTLSRSFADKFTVIEFDKTKHEQLIPLVEASDKPVLLDIAVMISTLIKRYGDKLTLIPVMILEPVSEVKSRLKSRGSTRLDNVERRYKRMLSLSKNYMHFTGNTQEVRKYLEGLVFTPIETKVCSNCHIEKLISEFYVRDKAKGTLRPRCKSCGKIKSIAYYQDNKEEKREYYQNNKEKILLRQKGTSKVYYQDNKEELKASSKIYKEEHKEEYAIWHKNHYQDNKEEMKASSKAHRDKNPGLSTFYSARRRAKVHTNTPDVCQAEDQLIKAMYIMRRIISNTFGEDYEIDHTQPVCKGGAHIFNNLQVITKVENRLKGSQFIKGIHYL